MQVSQVAAVLTLAVSMLLVACEPDDAEPSADAWDEDASTEGDADLADAMSPFDADADDDDAQREGGQTAMDAAADGGAESDAADVDAAGSALDAEADAADVDAAGPALDAEADAAPAMDGGGNPVDSGVGAGDGATDSGAVDAGLYGPDAGACARVSDYPEAGATLTDPQALRCLCGVSQPLHEGVVLDLGGPGDAAGQANVTHTVTGDEQGWTLWDNSTGMRLQVGSESLLHESTASKFLVSEGGDLRIRSMTDGSLEHTLPASLVGAFDRASFSRDGTYVWTYRGGSYRAFELDGQKWLDVALSTANQPSRSLARSDALFVWDVTMSGTGENGYLRRYPRDGSAYEPITFEGLFMRWLSETHFLTDDFGMVRIYRSDGTLVRPFAGTVSGGVGDFFWSNTALYVLSTGAKLTDYATLHSLTSDLMVFADAGQNPVYKLTRDTTGAWTGTALAPSDPILDDWVPPPPGPRLGCGPVERIVPLTGQRFVIVTAAGYFVYDGVANQVLSFTSLPGRLQLEFAESGNTLGVQFDGPDLALYFYSPLHNPARVGAASQEPVFRLSPVGDVFTVAPAVARNLDGGTAAVQPENPPYFISGDPPLVSPDGRKLVVRDLSCSYDCYFNVFQDGQSIGGITGRAEAWLNDQTVVTKSLVPSEVRAAKLDGTDAYAARCAAAFETAQVVGTAIFQRSGQGARLCDFASGTVTPVPLHRGAVARGVANGRALYVVGLEVVVAPY